MSTVVQPCARCGARWAVHGAPMHWCPRCRGVLLSPAPIDAPAERRNYRWVARRPDHRVRRGQAATSPGRDTSSTPRYTQMPRWGLQDPPPRPAAAPARPLGAFAKWVIPLLYATTVAFLLAASAELLRYLVLLYNRTRLVKPAVLWLSDGFVTVAAVVALLCALVAAVAAVGWLIETRRAGYAGRGRRDPRPVWLLVLGCLVPVANLLWPGVYLTEAAHGDPRALRAVRIWWAAWIAGGVLAVVALLWKFADGLQAEADGVLLTAWTDLAAALVAALTIWAMRAIEGRDVFGRTRIAHRWVIAVDPAVPVIEPVQPGGGRAAQSPDAEAHAAEKREHEEVSAK